MDQQNLWKHLNAFVLFRHIRPISTGTRKCIHNTIHQELTSWCSREKGTAEGCSLKIPDCFSPGLEWLITQAAKQEVLSVGSSHSTAARKLRQHITYSAAVLLGLWQRSDKHTCTCTRLHMNRHAHLCWNPGRMMCADLWEIFFWFSGRPSKILRWAATHRRVYPFSSRIQEQGDSPTSLLLIHCRATVKTCHYWIFTAVLSDGCSATRWCETSPHTSPALLLSRWMQPEEVWGGCWKG